MSIRVAVVTVLAFSFLVVPAAFARVGIHDKLRWPDGWPAALADIQADGQTFTVMNKRQETVVELRFRTREAFLEAWPTLVDLVSHGAPIKATTAQSIQDPNQYWAAGAPIVRVHAPSSGTTYVRGATHRLKVAPPWPAEIVAPDGALPEWVRVVVQEDGEPKLVPVDADASIRGAKYRCRVEIEVIADERIIYKSDIYRMPGNGNYIDADAPAPEPSQLQRQWGEASR